MTPTEAARLVDLLRALWPSKFHWTAEMAELWADRLARPDWTAAQVEAVIRDERATDNAAKPNMARVLERCHKAHQPARAPVANGNQHEDTTPAKWAEIHRDREGAAAWWFENRDDRAEMVRKATLAYPGSANKWARFLDAKFKPSPVQCMALKCAWQEFQENGVRPKPAYTPGIMARKLAAPAAKEYL